MTNLRTQEDLMRAQSLARESDVRQPHHLSWNRFLTRFAQESHDLLSFLKAHEGKRCVVVLEVRFIACTVPSTRPNRCIHVGN